jgi:hypothetical protein
VFSDLIKHLNLAGGICVFITFLFERTAMKIATTGQNKIIENLRKGYRRVFNI